MANFVTVLVPAAAVFMWIRGRNPLVKGALDADRTQTVGPVLEEYGGQSRRAARKRCESRTKRVLSGSGSRDVADELRWLDVDPEDEKLKDKKLKGKKRKDQKGKDEKGKDEELEPVRPVAMYGFGRSDTAAELAALSAAYRKYAVRLRARGLLGGGFAPIIGQEAEIADATARRLQTTAMFALGRASSTEDPTLTIALPKRKTHLALSHIEQGSAPGNHINVLTVTHVHERVVLAGQFSEWLANTDDVRTIPVSLEQSDQELVAKNITGKTFDGVLPCFRGALVERDPASGWRRLHLELAETSYSAIVATQYPGSRGTGRAREELNHEANVLTLSCTPVTSDGFLAFGRRSKHVFNAGLLTPAINGNLEMRQRFGILYDADRDGVPDPLIALAREAKEELALEMSTDRFRILGLTHFDSADEVGTHSLLTTCRVEVTAAHLARRAALADPAEGLWELDDDLWFLPERPPGGSQSADEWVDSVLRWSLNSPDHTPHLTSSLIAHNSGALFERFGSPEGVQAHVVSLVGEEPSPPPEGLFRLTRGE
ncbi:hypothetical protein BJ986_002834 [Phycicoccus badiiscoriae]|uniref:Nudix hydrolase domain-containing protein n=1 Tax=Pedococcus badiiscoriae TaxID=642776 RepID=A0A852WGK5_9MICO|nr:hypothetical protein [Pedococcus badiiscoriae]NYG08347.1 hypothetical protein [Pedococcus badiiscoriae]